MELRVLRYFLTVVEKESITEAARALAMTQPPLSREMKKLEEELGTPLFERGSRKIRLTDAGRALKARAEEMLALQGKIYLDVRSAAAGLKGDLRIACSENESMKAVMRAIDHLHRDNPGMLFHLVDGKAEESLDLLQNDEVDFAVVLEPVPFFDFDVVRLPRNEDWGLLSRKYSPMSGLQRISPAIDYDFLRLPERQRWGLLMRKDCPLAEKDAITPADLLSVELIISSQRMIKEQLVEWTLENYNRLNVLSTFSLVYNASLLVEETGACAVVLEQNFPGFAENQVFRPLAPELHAETAIIWKKRTAEENRSAAVFLDTLMEVLREMGHT